MLAFSYKTPESYDGIVPTSVQIRAIDGRRWRIIEIRRWQSSLIRCIKPVA
jgi:hypothetical protein